MKTKLLVGLVLLFAVAGVAYASNLPPDVEEFRNDCGYVCYVWPDGSGDCYPCAECESREPTERPPTEVPTKEPTPEPTEKCNRGLGNGSEGCDPGNSGGKPGAAGEGNE
jgi:hypothetical protein